MNLGGVEIVVFLLFIVGLIVVGVTLARRGNRSHDRSSGARPQPSGPSPAVGAGGVGGNGGAVVVASRNVEFELADLGMSCNDRELAHLANGDTGESQWFGFGGVEGTACRAPGDSSQIQVRTAGVISMCIGQGRVVGIVGPVDGTEAAVWFGFDLAGLGIATEGSAGLFAKRPKQIAFGSPEVQVQARDVNRLFPSGTAQKRQDHKFLAALKLDRTVTQVQAAAEGAAAPGSHNAAPDVPVPGPQVSPATPHAAPPEPRWDAEHEAYISWDGQRWLRYDQTLGDWAPL